MNLNTLQEKLYQKTFGDVNESISTLKSLITPDKSSFQNYQLIFGHYLHVLMTEKPLTYRKALIKLINILDYIDYYEYKKYNDSNLISSIKIQADLMNLDENTYLQKIAALLLDNSITPDFDKINIIINEINILQKYAKHNKLQFNLNKKLLNLIVKNYANSPQYY